MQPIIFSRDMVHAILLRKKTEARRVVKASSRNQVCPYGRIGDKLWVRETFAIVPPLEKFCLRNERDEMCETTYVRLAYQANLNPNYLTKHFERPEDEVLKFVFEHRYEERKAGRKPGEKHLPPFRLWRRPSMMPKWASRLTLRLTKIQKQKLQDITEEDIAREGFSREEHPSKDCQRLGCLSTPQEAFRLHWNQTNRNLSDKWEKNPLVWVLTFKEIDKPPRSFSM